MYIYNIMSEFRNFVKFKTKSDCVVAVECFSSGELFHYIYEVDVSCLCPLFRFCPGLPSEETPALC